jgi:hypothetical protein
MASCSLDRITYTGNCAVSSLRVLGISVIIHPGVFVRCSVIFVVCAVCSLLLWEEVAHIIPYSFLVCVCVRARVRACVITALIHSC